MSYGNPYVEWTDEIGAARLTCLAHAFQNWTPDRMEYGDTQFALGTGRLFFFGYRTDYLAYFEIPNIANTELELAMRLKSWLARGGEIVVTTLDSESHVYNCVQAPMDAGGSAQLPALTFSDTTELEYTLALWVKNTDTPDPRPMPYTPTAQQRPGRIVLSPSTIETIALVGGGEVIATMLDSGDNPMAGVELDGSSDDETRFTVSPSSGTTDADGNVTFNCVPVATGDATLTVAGAGKTASAPVEVLDLILGLPSHHGLFSVSDGDPVTGMTDISAGAWNLTVEGSNPPLWDTSVLNTSILFDQTFSEALANADFDGLETADAFTVFIVSRLTAGGLFSCGAGSTGYLLYGYLASGFFQFAAGDLAWRAKYAWTPDGADHIHTMVYKGAGAGNAGKVQHYLDGAAKTMVFDGTVPAAMSLGGPGFILGRAIGGTYMSGNYATGLIVRGALSAATLANLHAMIGAAYGIPVT